MLPFQVRKLPFLTLIPTLEDSSIRIALIPEKPSADDAVILTVNATDSDSEKNGRIQYSIKPPVSGFSIGETTGIVLVNASRVIKPSKNSIQLTVYATDSGKPTLSSTTTVRVHVDSNGFVKPQFVQNQYR